MKRELNNFKGMFTGLREGKAILFSGNVVENIDKEILLIDYTIYETYKGKVINEIQLRNKEERYDFLYKIHYQFLINRKNTINYDWSVYSIEDINNNNYGKLIYNYKNNPFKPSHYDNNYGAYPELHYDNFNTYMNLIERIKYYKRQIDYYIYSNDNIDEYERESNLEVLNEYYDECNSLAFIFKSKLFLNKPED